MSRVKCIRSRPMMNLTPISTQAQLDKDDNEEINIQLKEYIMGVKEKVSYEAANPDLFDNISLRYLAIQVESLLEIDRNEAEKWIVTIYPAAGKISDNINILDQASYKTSHRAIIPFGSREHFSFKINANKQTSLMVNKLVGNGVNTEDILPYETFVNERNIFCLSEVTLPSQLNISYDDNNTVKIPAKKGYRAGVYEKKNPKKRWIVVVDVIATNSRLRSFLELFKKSKSEEDELIEQFLIEEENLLLK